MTYMKCTCNKVKMFATAFWLTLMVLAAFFVPTILLPLAFLAMFHGAYLMLDPIPLPIVLSFVAVLSVSFFAAYINLAPVS